jgi:septum formation protein
MTIFNEFQITLASQSPRRKELLQAMNIRFDTCETHVDESYPDDLDIEEIAPFLSKKKSDFFAVQNILPKQIIITADTIVSLNNKVIPKPENIEEAALFLQELSDNMHHVYTGVTLKSIAQTHTFFAKTKVWFKELTTKEIEYYISNYSPLDKAGAYGIQEWIGYIGIEKIEGSYFNVMGLPTCMLYYKLQDFTNRISR